jgi:hypothetical protein
MSNYFKSVQTNRTLKRMAPLFVLTILLIGLPMLGAIATGHPMSLYLEFPPRTRYVQHAPFSWSAFALVSTFALVAGGSLYFSIYHDGLRSLGSIQSAIFPTGVGCLVCSCSVSGCWRGGASHGSSRSKVLHLHLSGPLTWSL